MCVAVLHAGSKEQGPCSLGRGAPLLVMLEGYVQQVQAGTELFSILAVGGGGGRRAQHVHED